MSNTSNTGKRKAVKHHVFGGRRYLIDHVERIDGVCDDAKCEANDPPNMLVLDGDNLRTLHSQLHEGLEASGFCDKCLHDRNGEPRTWDVARFLWREGWRKSN